jgi:hypothetical protein
MLSNDKKNCSLLLFRTNKKEKWRYLLLIIWIYFESSLIHYLSRWLSLQYPAAFLQKGLFAALGAHIEYAFAILVAIWMKIYGWSNDMDCRRVESCHFLPVLYCGTDSLPGISAWGLCDLMEMCCWLPVVSQCWPIMHVICVKFLQNCIVLYWFLLWEVEVEVIFAQRLSELAFVFVLNPWKSLELILFFKLLLVI